MEEGELFLPFISRQLFWFMINWRGGRTYADDEKIKNGDVSLNACAPAARAARKGSVVHIVAIVFSMLGSLKLEVMSKLDSA